MSYFNREARGGLGDGNDRRIRSREDQGRPLFSRSRSSFSSLLFALRPLMVDGDGLAHATRAIYSGFLEGMLPQHALAASLFRCVYLPLEWIGLRRYSIVAIAAISHLSAVGVFLLLAMSIYPRFIADRRVSLLCALGAVLSFGVISRSATIEVYAPALFLAVALVAYGLRADFTRPLAAAGAGLLFVLAVGVHVANVLLGPFLLALLLWRAGRARAASAAAWAAAAFVLGMAGIAAMMLVGRGASLWPPDLEAIRPRGDFQPAMSLAGRASRMAYGAARTVAYLPPVRELEIRFAVLYGFAMAAAAMTFAYVARHRRPSKDMGRRGLYAMLAMLAAPFIGMAAYYYPSDPERWLFLMPLLWLVVGLAWDGYAPAPHAWLSLGRSRALLAAIVLFLGAYNAIAGLLPNALRSRELAGFQGLARLTTPDDLVISPAGIKGQVLEFYLGKPFEFENLTLTSLVDRHRDDHAGLQSDLRSRIEDALRRGRPTFVHNVIGEGHVKNEGYPWSHFEYGHGPESLMEVLKEFDAEVVIPPGRDRTGTYRLNPAPTSGTAADAGAGPVIRRSDGPSAPPGAADTAGSAPRT